MMDAAFTAAVRKIEQHIEEENMAKKKAKKGKGKKKKPMKPLMEY